MELIKIEERNGKQFVDARKLHEALESGRRFSDWIKDRIERYGFTENVDFQKVSQKNDTLGGVQNCIDYLLSVQTAKEIAMVENNEKGKYIRQYLIKLETAWNTPELIMARALQVANKTIEDYSKRVIEAERKNAILMHVSKTYTASEIAKELGLRSAQELNQAMSDCKIQYKVNGTWFPSAQYSECGYFIIKQQELDNGKVIYDRKITQLGREFLIEQFKAVK